MSRGILDTHLILGQEVLAILGGLLEDALAVEQDLDVWSVKSKNVVAPLELRERKVKDTLGVTCLLSDVGIDHLGAGSFLLAGFAVFGHFFVRLGNLCLFFDRALSFDTLFEFTVKVLL